ncbi:isoamyl alcohol oxidase-like protein [Sporormia fimetaria CBS 119925]|uniref:Isoamyl alcohol oxidase-like protein n=1 Tax=Sporormia fimetaria CBS 119925 TaxID=1340428 RepID=A0A6A6V813_9PLEO|nr:isoamyl alcohol oxidase-like protein [Sporormia fimetaria CBS 119925]
MVANIAVLLLGGAAACVQAAAYPSHAPLFDYERRHLTPSHVSRWSPENRALFRFDSDEDFQKRDLRQRKGECKVFPGDKDWPSDKEWEKFNKQVDGALIPTVPLAAPCYKNWGVYDQAKCAEITARFTDPYLHTADPASGMWPTYQGRTCLAHDSPNDNCTLGGYPSYAVKITNVAQIQTSINFARNKNLRLVIKNTGHDFLGKSLGAGSLSLWTHALKDLDFIESYKSDSGYRGPAIKVGAGVIFRELYDFAHEKGVIVAGGICETVGYAGGYFALGGHTPMSGYYGMAADSIEAIQLVTADGKFITASSKQNAELFWALRGGGGSTFGVVTSVITRAHPKMPVVTTTLFFGVGGDVTNDIFWQGIKAYFEQFPLWAENRAYTFFVVGPGFFDPTQLSFALVPFWAPGHTIESSNKLLQPWLDRLAELGIQVTPNVTRFDSFKEAHAASWPGITVGSVGLNNNRLFPKSIWEDAGKFERFMGVLRRHVDEGRSIVGYFQAPRNRLNVDNAVSSAWRHANAFLLSGAPIEGGENATQAQLQAAAKNNIEYMEPWRELSRPRDFGGSYGNEGDVVEPKWQEEFYGIQYERLLRVKGKWDPKDVFYATTAVGSERWEVRDGDWGTQTQMGRLCRI